MAAEGELGEDEARRAGRDPPGRPRGRRPPARPPLRRRQRGAARSPPSAGASSAPTCSSASATWTAIEVDGGARARRSATASSTPPTSPACYSFSHALVRETLLRRGRRRRAASPMHLELGEALEAGLRGRARPPPRRARAPLHRGGAAGRGRHAPSTTRPAPPARRPTGSPTRTRRSLYAKALDALELAPESDPRPPAASCCSTLGPAQTKAARPDDARATLEAARRASPASSTARSDFARAALGICLLSRRRDRRRAR